MIQTAIAILLLVGLGFFFACMARAGRRETKRRAALAKEERERLEREDAIWSQEYGF